jgi:hypothetical protein
VVIPSGPSEVDAEVFSETLCPLPALVFSGGRVPASDPPAPASRFPPLGGGDALVLLPIPLAAAAEATSTMDVGLPDTVCASQSETRVSSVAANIGSRAKGNSPFYLHARVTGVTTINVLFAPPIKARFPFVHSVKN